MNFNHIVKNNENHSTTTTKFMILTKQIHEVIPIILHEIGARILSFKTTKSSIHKISTYGFK